MEWQRVNGNVLIAQVDDCHGYQYVDSRFSECQRKVMLKSIFVMSERVKSMDKVHVFYCDDSNNVLNC
jgi:hypothetical protein